MYYPHLPKIGFVFDLSCFGFYIMNSMKILKLTTTLILPLLCVGLLQAQSLAELAKKEKERRAKLQGKKSIVVTNEDLKKMDFKPGLISRPLLERENSATERQASSPAAKVKKPPQAKSAPLVDNIDQEGLPAAVIELEEKWKRANDTVGFLNLKLGSLWQQYYSGAAVSLDLLQGKIGLTYLELQAALKEAEELRLKLETAKKKKSP
jgi:hypothetical protein